MADNARVLTGVTFLVGGARSGKSTLAVTFAVQQTAPVTFVATAEGFDADMAERIAAHRRDRPSWPTIEAPVELSAAFGQVPVGHLVIVDCLTVWVANLFHHLPGHADRRIRYDALVEVLGDRSNPTIIVSNEVGLGLHPETPIGREYRDEIGRLNQRIAAFADRSLLLVAGKALLLGDPLEMIS